MSLHLGVLFFITCKHIMENSNGLLSGTLVHEVKMSFGSLVALMAAVAIVVTLVALTKKIVSG